MHTQQQRAKGVRGGPGRICIAADHELLPLYALQLDPVLRACRAIWSAIALADQSFELQIAGMLEQFAGRHIERPAEHQRCLCLLQYRFEQCTPRVETCIAQVVAIEVRQVKNKVLDLSSSRILERILQGLETGTVLAVKHHYFSVEPAILYVERCDRFRNMRELCGPVVAIARE